MSAQPTEAATIPAGFIEIEWLTSRDKPCPDCGKMCHYNADIHRCDACCETAITHWIEDSTRPALKLYRDADGLTLCEKCVGQPEDAII